MATETKLKPQAFRIGKPGAAEPAPETFTLEPVEDFVEAEAAKAGTPIDPAERAVESAQGRGITRSSLISWGGLFFSAAGGFILVALSNWLISLVVELFYALESAGLCCGRPRRRRAFRAGRDGGARNLEHRPAKQDRAYAYELRGRARGR